MTKDMVVSAKVPGGVIERLDRLARARGAASRSSAVRDAIARGLEDLERAHELWLAEVEAQRRGAGR